MSTTLVKSPSGIRSDILTLQDYLWKYQELVLQHQVLRSDIMRAKEFFEYIVQQIEKAIPQIALFTLISSYQDDRTQDQFYQLLDAIIESLQEFYDTYQEQHLRNLFDFNDFIHTCRATGYFAQLDNLFNRAATIATRAIINELN